jgi:MFS family permease
MALGLLGGLDNLLGALYSYPGGYLSDRFGQKKAMLIFNLAAMTGFSLVILVHAWWSVVLGASLFLAWSAVSLPASMSLIAAVMPHRRRVLGVSLHALIRRIPMILGPLLGGWLIAHYQASLGREAGLAHGIRMSFTIALALAALGTWVQWRFMASTPPLAKPEGKPWRVWRFFSADLKVLLAADILVRFAEQIPYAFIAVWCVQLNGLSALEFGWLKAIEMTVAMLIYLPVAWAADKGGKKGYVVATFVFFAAFPALLYATHSFWAMVPVFVLRGLKEFGEPARKALIMELAPDEHEASVFGLYYLIRDVLVSGAAFAAAWLWQAHPAANLLTATGFGLLGTLVFALWGKDAKTLKRARVR